MPMRWRWPPENSCGKRSRTRGGRPTRSQHVGHPRRASSAPALAPWISSGSMMMSSTDMRGLSAPYGSWKMICIGAALLAAAPSRRARDVGAVEQDGAAVGSISRISRRPSVDLPQPDSPTRPSVSPGMDVELHVVHRAQRRWCAGAGSRRREREMLGEAGGLDQRRHVPASSGTRMQAAAWPGSLRRQAAEWRRRRPAMA